MSMEPEEPEDPSPEMSLSTPYTTIYAEVSEVFVLTCELLVDRLAEG